MDDTLVYTPPASLAPFFVSDKFVNLVIGPIGSTKTTAGILKIAYEAKRVKAGRDGVRRSRCVWIRQTREQLQDTSIPDFLRWYPDGAAGSFMRTGLKFLLKFADVECEVLFRGLDDTNDVRRLLSLQATFAVADEFRELNMDIFDAMQGRLGRYPSKADNGVGACDDLGNQIDKFWGMSNPPDMDTAWEKYLSDPPANAAVFIQPSGLAPEADWTQYLKDDYYENLAEGKSKDWIDVYIHAKFGRSLAGEPVFRSFDADTHVSKTPLNILASPLVIGVDAGLSPAAVIGQLDYTSRLVVHDALISESMGALRFIRERLKPLLTNKYGGRTAMIVIDPAAFQRAQTDERTVADIFKAEGFTVKPARTNTIAARLAAVENYLTRTVEAKPAIVLDPVGCGPLITALRSKYRYKINSKGEKDDTPDKTHPWSDVCFIAGTQVATEHGFVTIESLRPGDLVAVPDGLDRVVGIGDREVHPGALLRLTLSDGAVLTCTRDHPFAVKNSHTRFLPADALTCKHILVSKEEGLWASGPNLTLARWRCSAFVRRAARHLKRQLGGFGRGKESFAPQSVVAAANALAMASSLTDFGLPELARTPTSGTSDLTRPLWRYTSTSGLSTTDLSQLDSKSITRTTTRVTTPSTTWNSSSKSNTQATTSSDALSQVRSILRRPSPLLGKLQRLGTGLMKVVRGTAGTRPKSPLTVVRKDYLSEGARVFSLMTERTDTYYADSALVHNCDGLQYLCLHADNGAVVGQLARSSMKQIVRKQYTYV